MTTKCTKKRWIHVIARAAFGTLVGVAVGALVWVLYLVLEGQNIVQALRGNVPDGLDTLQALIVLGAMVGAAVGVVYGLVMAIGE